MRIKRLLTTILLLSFVAQLLPVASLPALAQGSTPDQLQYIWSYTVNSTADPGDGVCDSNECTLREAIYSVPPSGSIYFDLPLPATITLQAGQLVINKSMTIYGPGKDQLIINGNSDGENGYRVLQSRGGGIVLNGMTLSNGMTGEPGGGIYNTGQLTLKDVAVKNNWSIPVPSGLGGGIYNAENGVLYLNDVSVQGNHAYMRGAGILNVDDASIYMQNTIISDNEIGYSGFGGGISNQSRGKIWIQIAPNGDWLPGTSQIVGNWAGGAAAFESGSDFRMLHTLVQGNTSENGFVAIANYGFLSVIESSITGNGSGEGYGGAILNGGTLEFVRSLMSGNSAFRGTGGLTNGGKATIVNSTISSHYTSRDMGVIHNSGDMTITNSTISDALLASYDPTGAAIVNLGTLKMGNTIIANSTLNCLGTITTLGGNLSDDDSCALNGIGDRNNVDAGLDVLKDNGGPTLTHALISGSPAIDTADNTQCPTTDQRNEARPKDGNGDGKAICDIGAYEAPEITSWPQADVSLQMYDHPDPVMRGQNLTYILSVINHGPQLAIKTRLYDSLPANGEFISATSSDGNCSFDGHVITCELFSLDVDKEVMIQIRVKPTVDGVLMNRADVTTSSNDIKPDNNHAEEQTIVLPLLTTITIHQETQPKSTQDFAFYGPFGKFYLDNPETDDGDAYPMSMTYTVNPGTYNFAQGVFQSWYLADIQCVGAGQSVNNMSLRSVGITVKAGEQMICTFVTQRRVNLQAIKFNDLNADGMRQANEPTLTPWEFRFYKSDGTLINHKVTDANGSAVQNNVIPGSFKVCETPKAGWTNTLPGQADPLLGLSCYNLTVPPGGNASLLFGNTQASVVRPAQEFDSLSGVAMGELSDINEPESEKPVGERSQSIYLPLINR